MSDFLLCSNCTAHIFCKSMKRFHISMYSDIIYYLRQLCVWDIQNNCWIHTERGNQVWKNLIWGTINIKGEKLSVMIMIFIWHNKTSDNIQVWLRYKILSTEEVNRHTTGIKGTSKLIRFCIIAQIQHIYYTCRRVQLTSICGSRFLGFTVNISLILLCFNVSFFSSIFLCSQSGCLTLGTGFASCKEDKYLTCKWM